MIRSLEGALIMIHLPEYHDVQYFGSMSPELLEAVTALVIQ